ncbi:MAG TPA: Hpt domain-containing protein, partial [Myxococcaceae bacterium]|nr:Hpt domain-containing protein [Myxococcaceae bacterium]
MTSSAKGLSDFVAEATEILETLNRDLSILDQRRGERLDPGLVNGIFRSSHSLKGLAAMFGEQRIAQLAHHTEDLLDRLRLGRLDLTNLVVDALLESFDAFQVVLRETERREHSPDATERAQTVCRKLAQLSETASALPEDDALDRLDLDASVRSVLTEYEEHRLLENLRAGMAVWKVRAVFALANFDQGLGRLNSKLKAMGEVLSTLPSADPGDGTGIAFDIIFGCRTPPEKLKTALAGISSSLHPLLLSPEREAAPPAALDRQNQGSELDDSPAALAVAPAQRNPPQTRPVPPVNLPRPAAESRLATRKERPAEADSSDRLLTQTVRVDIGRLDSLMDAVGELLLIKANVARLADQANQPGKPASGKLWGRELHRESRLLERKLDDLQKGILEVRMVPLGQVFDKLARTVRRIARESGKEVDFVMHGG